MQQHGGPASGQRIRLRNAAGRLNGGGLSGWQPGRGRRGRRLRHWHSRLRRRLGSTLDWRLRHGERRFIGHGLTGLHSRHGTFASRPLRRRSEQRQDRPAHDGDGGNRAPEPHQRPPNRSSLISDQRHGVSRQEYLLVLVPHAARITERPKAATKDDASLQQAIYPFLYSTTYFEVV
jgi:hypothetical protein